MKIRESVVDEVLRSEDIETLFQHGAPENEYTPEVQRIMGALAQLDERDTTEERLVTIIRGVWNQMFGPFSEEELEMRMPAFRQAAHRIWSET